MIERHLNYRVLRRKQQNSSTHDSDLEVHDEQITNTHAHTQPFYYNNEITSSLYVKIQK